MYSPLANDNALEDAVLPLLIVRTRINTPLGSADDIVSNRRNYDTYRAFDSNRFIFSLLLL